MGNSVKTVRRAQGGLTLRGISGMEAGTACHLLSEAYGQTDLRYSALEWTVAAARGDARQCGLVMGIIANRYWNKRKKRSIL